MSAPYVTAMRNASAEVKHLVNSLRGVDPVFWWVMVLKFTESFTYFALSQILVIYLRSEYGLTDIEAGFAYGSWGFMISAWSILMSCVNDSLGIRRALLVGFSLEIVGNFLLAFARTRALAYLSLFGILPLGSCLGIPMLLIAVKRFSPEESKGFAFGVFYTVMNIAALASGPVVDLFNIGRDPGTPFIEGSYITGNRMVILTCAFSSVLSFVFTKVYLVEAPVEGGGGEEYAQSFHSEDRLVSSVDSEEQGVELNPMQQQRLMHVLEAPTDSTEITLEEDNVSQSPKRMHNSGVDGGDENNHNDNDNAERRPPGQKLGGTPLSVANVKGLVNTKRFWRFVVLTLFLINLRAIFRHLDATFPTYLLREHGNNIPKGLIYSINPFMIIFLTPLVTAFATRVPDYDMIRNGSWITGLSALPLVFSSTILSSCLFVIFLSFGECIWSPASYHYAMAVAPDGREATFGALAAAPLFAAKIPVGLLGGYLLETFMPAEGPRQPKMLWLVIMLATVSSPICLSLFERCVRQPRDKEEAEEAVHSGESEEVHEAQRGAHLRLRTDSAHSEES